MPELSLKRVSEAGRPSAQWATATLAALAREEQLDRRPRRLLEPEHATWRQFRGRLGWRDLLELLAEDAAVVHPNPFDAELLLGSNASRLENVPEKLVKDWLAELDGPTSESADYVLEQAKRLGCPTLFARSNLHQIKPHHKVLELPGSGGQLAHHVATTQEGIYVQDVFTIACNDWRELALAGFIAVELRAPSSSFAVLDPDLEQVRERSYDYVFGLQPDKGGPDVDRQRLMEIFAPATVVLV